MTAAALTEVAGRHSLDIFGACHTVPEDGLGNGTLFLLGPAEPGFWRHVNASPEFADEAHDPMDRWSARVISEIAAQVGGTALFPFGSPPRPFISWALRSGRAWVSPVGMLVHDIAGLMVSFRGAVFFESHFDLAEASTTPCDECVDQPCLSACPVGALSGQGYDLPTCHGYLDTRDGQDCMSQGCAVRRICPVSQRYQRDPAQSAFHMASFHPA